MYATPVVTKIVIVTASDVTFARILISDVLQLMAVGFSTFCNIQNTGYVHYVSDSIGVNFNECK